MTTRTDAIALAAIVGNDWTHGSYYELAESSMEHQWSNLIWPMIKGGDFQDVVEIASGHGRNTQRLAALGGRVVATDINQENIDILEARFRDHPNVIVMRNSGADLRAIPGASASFVYSFDAMVHFDSDIIRCYIREIRRIMKPGGRGFCHYSDFSSNPTGTYRDHPGWRNFMSRELFEHWLSKEGFRVLESRFVASVTSFTEDRVGADNMTFFELPIEAAPGGGFLSVEERLQDLQAELQRQDADRIAVERELEREQAERRHLEDRLALMASSTSWRATQPLRWAKQLFVRR